MACKQQIQKHENCEINYKCNRTICTCYYAPLTVTMDWVDMSKLFAFFQIEFGVRCKSSPDDPLRCFRYYLLDTQLLLSPLF